MNSKSQFCVIIITLLVGAALSQETGKPWLDPMGWIRENQVGSRFRNLSNPEIKMTLSGMLNDPKFSSWKETDFEPLLSEITTRERAIWEPFLIEATRNFRPSSHTDSNQNLANYEVLNSLRKLQNAPQPLQINTDKLDVIDWEFPTLPILNVAITQHKEETEDFLFTFGGNYRSGRQTRWTILTWNDKGEMIPRKLRFGGGRSGGIAHKNALLEQSWETTIRIHSFIETPLLPGTYRICLAYHNEASIAQLGELGGKALSLSKPILFRVVPRRIKKSSPSRAAEIDHLVHLLPSEGVVRICAGSYDESVHEFIDPDSNVGKLLSMNWNDLPLILQSLNSPKLKPTQKAWGLGILYSISSIVDPTQSPNVLGKFVKHTKSGRIVNRINGKFANAARTLAGTQSYFPEEIEPIVQQTLLDKWNLLLNSSIEYEE